MRSRRNTCLSLSVLVSFLASSSIGYGQWPIRYNDPFNGNDVATCIAKDAFGNTYVAGHSDKGPGFRRDIVVDSYDFLGVRRPDWPKYYDGPGHGDDLSTSIHVNPDGSVIVAGTSYGGTDSKFDLFAIKYTTNGEIVWPVSGTAGTGAVYHNGAVRTVQVAAQAIEEGAKSPILPGPQGRALL